MVPGLPPDLKARALKAQLRTLLLLGLGAASPALAEAPVTLEFEDRPPYIHREADGRVGGLIAERAAAAFGRAGIPFAWAEVPIAREFAALQENQERICVPGWFKTEERQRFAKYTKAIYQDAGVVLVAGPAFRPPPDLTIDTLLADPDLHFLFKEGMVYGPGLEAKLGGMRARHLVTGLGWDETYRMVREGHGVAFVSKEEAEYRIGLAGSDSGYKVLRFPELEPGERRYILCSRQVEDPVIERIDAALPTEPR